MWPSGVTSKDSLLAGKACERRDGEVGGVDVYQLIMRGDDLVDQEVRAVAEPVHLSDGAGAVWIRA